MPPRITGMASAASALRYWERRQEVLSNNLANVSTDGFRGERVFAQMMGDALPAAQTATDVRAGALRPTTNPLDLALQGDGFFVVQTPAGERFSRGGAFRLDAERRIVDADGRALLGAQGPIVVPPGGELAVTPSGDVSLDGKTIASLRVERPGPGAALAHDAGTLLVPDDARRSVPPEERRVRQGMIEESNVSSVGALVDMISVQRAYAAIQKVITTIDGARQTAVNDLGKPV
jgi:flagellar basal body rod protein FlgG